MMQIPSSNHISTPKATSSRRKSPRSSLLRFFDQTSCFVDRFCCSTSYQSSQMVSEDDDSIYYEGTRLSTSSSSPSSPRKKSDNSVIWDAAEDSIHWLVESKRQRQQQGVGGMKTMPTHQKDTRNHNDCCGDKGPGSPAASDATATTVFTDNTRSSNSNSNSSQDLYRSQFNHSLSPSSETRAHSTGAMRDPEREHLAAEKRATRRPSEIYLPAKSFRRVHSESCPMLPFKSSSTYHQQQ